ncbi:MAG: HNH endonuclease [Bdellovibrionaceae bacterium]|jgi:hypothetical protein|nr:HNH endonuclease [Pseudobdellovibrionaceae bacterium]
MQLHKELLVLRENENKLTSEILDKLQLMEKYRSYLKLGYSSLFDYLVRGLSYSESMAYQRQSCLRLSNDLPEIKEKLDQGKLTHSNISLAYKLIKDQSIEKKREVLKTIENKSFREAKRILAPKAPTLKMKQLVYQDKVLLKIELSRHENDRLNKLKALLAHQCDLEELFMKLVDKELMQYNKTDYKTSRSSNPRYISVKLRNSLLKNANYKCQYTGCQETHFLQIDHIHSVRKGGLANPGNLQVLCAAHNREKG